MVLPFLLGTTFVLFGGCVSILCGHMLSCRLLSGISQDKLVKIAKKLKKNSVAVDIISFGCEAENEEKLNTFYEAVNSNNNSHLVTVPPGPVLSDVLISSPIFQGEGAGFGFGGGAGAATGGEGGAGFEFGIDPNLDPELALALRVSLEEERARQNAMAAAAAGGAPEGAGADVPPAATPAPAAAAPVAGGAGDMDLDEDALLQQALAMSMAVDQETPAPAAQPAATPVAPPAPAPAQQPAAGDAAMYDDVEDEELRMALALSMQDAAPQDKVGTIIHLSCTPLHGQHNSCCPVFFFQLCNALTPCYPRFCASLQEEEKKQ